MTNKKSSKKRQPLSLEEFWRYKSPRQIAMEEDERMARTIQRLEGQRVLRSLQGQLKTRTNELSETLNEKRAKLELLISEAEQIRKEENDILSRIAELTMKGRLDYTLDDLQLALTNKIMLYAGIPATLASLREDKANIQDKLNQLIDNDNEVKQLRDAISSTRTEYGIAE